MLTQIFFYMILPVIRHKGESQNGFSRKQNTSNFPRNEHFLAPDKHTYLFCWNALALLPYYQRFDVWLPSIHSAWHYRISLLFEFLTAERDWKFLLIRMFNNRKCSLDIVGIIFAEAYSEPSLSNISKMEFLLKIVIF